jgi:DNA-binding HxlR family transcriptional regulator
VRQTGFPRWYVKRQARRLGLTMHPDRRPWTQNKLDTLERLIGKVSAATIAKRLKRMETSVVMKVKALGHSRRVSDGYTMRDLEECIGEDHRKIQKWIANGWLRDRLQGTKRHDGNGYDIHRFREDDILDFIKKHPMDISLGKVDQTWFLDLVLLRGLELHPIPNSSRRAENDGTKGRA